MAYSKIIITFNEDLAINNAIGFQISSPVPNYILAFPSFRWVNIRSGQAQVSIGSPTSIPGERSAINFVSAFNADWNATNIYNVLILNNTVTILSTISSIEFSNTFYKDFYYLSETLPQSKINFSIENYAGSVYSVSSIAFSEATVNSKCVFYKVTIQTNLLTDSVTGSYPIPSGNTDNPIVFELYRGQSFNITLYSSDGQSINLFYNTNNVPGYINEGFFTINIVNPPSGATVLITPLKDFPQATVEYSLDNVNWQESNEFIGLLEGNYTLYVRDGLGCSFTTTFSITNLTVLTPYFLMPKSNSIRFANRVTWGDCANYKTEENTLSCESTVKEPWKQILLFQSCDVITTQFRSNYATNTATIIQEDGTEINVPVLRVTDNRGLKDKRDARKYNLGGGKTGIYFISGNIYNYDTGIDTGDDYLLNGLLPSWAIVGTYLSIDSAWYLIEDIITDETVNAQVIVISSTYTGSDVLIQVSSIYDLQNYDEFEFTIDFVDYIDEKIQVRVNAVDTVFDDVEQLSELIEVKIKHEDTCEIRYKNAINTDLNYSRGLENKIRLLLENIRALPLEESETNKTDTTARLTESMVYEMDEFVFSPMTTQMMRLTILALNHSTVFINGVSYIKNDNISVEGPLEDTNLYDLKATMIKGNSPFNSNVVNGSNTINSSDTELPGLIESDSGYVSY